MQMFKKILSALLITLLSVAVIIPVKTHADVDLFDFLFDEDYDSNDTDNDNTAQSDTGLDADTAPTGEFNDLSNVNNETGYKAWVYDQACLFSQTDAKTILDEAYKLTEYSEIYVVTIPAGGNPHGKTESATKDYGDEFYIKYCNKDNSIMFIIDMHTRYIFVYRYGNVKDTLTQGKCDTITDNIYSYASDKNYLKCTTEGLDQIGKVLNGMHIAQPMKVVSNIFLASVFGFMVMYFVALGKSKVRKTSDAELLKYAIVNFKAQNPTDIVTGTTKTYCPRSSGSSGHGRSHGGGGGGGFHGGGGGGHRF